VSLGHALESSPASLEDDALLLAEEHQIIGDHVADMQVDDPVHQVEAHKAHGEYDARVLVDVGGRDAQQLVDVLYFGDQGSRIKDQVLRIQDSG